MKLIPSQRLFMLLACGALAALAALIVGVEVTDVAIPTLAGMVLLGAVTCADYLTSRRAWRSSVVHLSRNIPPAFALGARRPVTLNFEIEGPFKWRGQVYDDVDPSFNFEGLPASVELLPGKRIAVTYEVTPTRRGEALFGTAQLRLQSRWGWCELLERIGAAQTRRVYPDF